jgi:phage tail-like protein
MAELRKDPYSAFQFKVWIDDKEVAGFSEVSGLAFEAEVETFREGGVNDREQQRAGPAKFPSRLVLKRGIGDLKYLWSWYQDVTKGKIARRKVTIVLNAGKGKDPMQWTAHETAPPTQWIFKEACPVKWTGPELRANTSAIAFEAVELIHRGLGE